MGANVHVPVLVTPTVNAVQTTRLEFSIAKRGSRSYRSLRSRGAGGSLSLLVFPPPVSETAAAGDPIDAPGTGDEACSLDFVPSFLVGDFFAAGIGSFFFFFDGADELWSVSTGSLRLAGLAGA